MWDCLRVVGGFQWWSWSGASKLYVVLCGCMIVLLIEGCVLCAI